MVPHKNYNIPDYPHIDYMMTCPKCESEKTQILSLTYPATHECSDCGHVFMEARRALIDE